MIEILKTKKNLKLLKLAQRGIQNGNGKNIKHLKLIQKIYLRRQKNSTYTMKSGFCFSLTRAIYTTFVQMLFESLLYCCKIMLAMALCKDKSVILLLAYF